MLSLSTSESNQKLSRLYQLYLILVIALNNNNLLKTTRTSFLSFAQANKNRLSFGDHFERNLIKDIHRSFVESLGSNG